MHLDPKTPVAKEIGGVTYLLRVLTEREKMRFAVHADALGKRLRASADGEVATLDEQDIERLERSLVIGVAGWEPHPDMPEWKADGTGHMRADLLDAIPGGLWVEIWVAIIEANEVGAAEAKNSPSP